MDPTTWITSRTVNVANNPVIKYENIDGKRWKIVGECNACGLCETPPTDGSNFSIQNNVFINENNEIESYSRTLVWNNSPGVPGACLETNFNDRKDIPMTPDFVNEIDGCQLTGTWLKDAS
jgi:hypothetical protein